MRSYLDCLGGADDEAEDKAYPRDKRRGDGPADLPHEARVETEHVPQVLVKSVHTWTQIVLLLSYLSRECNTQTTLRSYSDLRTSYRNSECDTHTTPWSYSPHTWGKLSNLTVQQTHEAVYG